MRFIFLFYCLFSNVIFNPTANTFNCYLPAGCRLERGFVEDNNFYTNELGKRENIFFIMCDIDNNEFSFKFIKPPTFVTDQRCLIQVDGDHKIIFKWTSKELTILDRQFNFNNLFRYLNYMKEETEVYLWGLKGFDLNFLGEKWINYKLTFRYIHLSKFRLDFYDDKKKIYSCNDILASNITNIRSIFQVNPSYNIHIIMRNADYKQSICPLVFNNSDIYKFVLIDLVDTFYKRNVLSFTNETLRDLESNIRYVELHKVQNINLDLKLLHPLVFSNTIEIYIGSGSLNSIDVEIFKNLDNLYFFGLNPVIFKKINHKQGIEWIRQWNLGVNVNLSEIVKENISSGIITAFPKRLLIKQESRIQLILPDEDFCIYVDFPFNQFVIFYEYTSTKISSYNESELSCTFLWLAQYYDFYNKYFLFWNEFFLLTGLLDTPAFKSISKCNFKEKIDLCNKSNYRIKDIWDQSDIFILIKKMQIPFKIMLYPTALLGLITNIIVVIVILNKENTDLFKQFKQYSYLYLNSIFCIIIMVIELLSWMTECFYPFEVFCPEIRKLVPIQFFKIIFKECFITMLRFMCTFTYIAFALNRISLIGKDHGKLVTFFSELGIKVFIGVTILISSSLSWIKGFKYQVNYFFPYFNYPMSTEMDITIIDSNTFNDAYFIINFICDFFNYVLFVIICVIIDICMVVQLREVLGEKTKKIESMNKKQNETKKAENEKVVKKAIKMVVLNSAIGIFFKLPASFIPLLNVVAEFYYKDSMNNYHHPDFGEFYSMLHNTELHYVIQDISYFLYTLSLSIQIFIYYRFDKKFQTGSDRLREKAFNYIKNRFKKSDTSNT